MDIAREILSERLLFFRNLQVYHQENRTHPGETFLNQVTDSANAT